MKHILLGRAKNGFKGALKLKLNKTWNTRVWNKDQIKEKSVMNSIKNVRYDVQIRVLYFLVKFIIVCVCVLGLGGVILLK